MPSSLLYWLIVGGIAGWLTGHFMKGSGYGVVGDIVIGVIGGVIGGWLMGPLGIKSSGMVTDILVAFFGGVVLVFLTRTFRRS
jgi:uncharacterized membrane protein YeaQ/YmgE (transglycosylase-associated protein family)